MRARRGAAAAAAVTACAVAATVAASPSGAWSATPPASVTTAASAATTAESGWAWQWRRVRRLPAVSDATGLPGRGMFRARPVSLPGADATGAAQLSVLSGGIDRPYLLAPARRVAYRTDPALLIVLPAANTLLRSDYDGYRLDAFRDHGFTVLVAGPYGASWNAGACCGRPVREGVDDVAAITAMRDDAVARTGADPGRTAVIGHSVGAFMAWRLACTPDFGVTAVVAVSGTLVHSCPSLPTTPRFFALHGELDSTVPLDGSTSVIRLLGIAPPSVRRSAATLAAAGDCRQTASFDVGSSTILDRGGCTGGGHVRLQIVRGQGHLWRDLDGTRRAAAWLDRNVAGIQCSAGDVLAGR